MVTKVNMKSMIMRMILPIRGRSQFSSSGRFAPRERPRRTQNDPEFGFGEPSGRPDVQRKVDHETDARHDRGMQLWEMRISSCPEHVSSALARLTSYQKPITPCNAVTSKHNKEHVWMK